MLKMIKGVKINDADNDTTNNSKHFLIKNRVFQRFPAEYSSAVQRSGSVP